MAFLKMDCPNFKVFLWELVFMDYITGLIDQLIELAKKLVDSLFGQEPQCEPELIPIPVRDRR
jgi:hypothetical protein